MDQIQTPQPIPHIVQVYHPSETESKLQNPHIIHLSHPSLQTNEGKITYQHAVVTSKSLQIPDMSQQQIHMPQNQIVMSCQQTHLQNIHQPMQAQMTQQVLQSSDMSQPLHVILPQVPMFKQHVLISEVQQQYYGQYEPYDKSIETKEEPGLQTQVEKQLNFSCKEENTTTANMEENEQNTIGLKKRNRSLKPNPGTWACNVRKLKHQRGEAYISRRGKFVPERRVRNIKDCLKSCKYKCSARISDVDREHIFKAFYSLNANEKKHFLLNTTERNEVKHKSPDQSSKRRHAFKYFFLVRAVRHTVCKNFYLGTLAISQKPVYNVHIGKSEMNIPKPDGRGLSEASAHALPSEIKDTVRKHIMSFKTEDSKPVKRFSKKKQYLESNLSVKKMYSMYLNDCNKDNVIPVKESMYRKIFRSEFNLHFRKVKSEPQLCCKCKGVIKKKS